MTQQDPITPPAELVREWMAEYFGCTVADELSDSERFLAARAAQWGADYELMACLDHLVNQDWFTADHEAIQDLKASRRPKTPSLKEQALEALMTADGPDYPTPMLYLRPDAASIIRRALESIPDPS